MPLFWICLAIIIGIAAAPFLSISNPVGLLLFILVLIILIIETITSRTHLHPLISQPLFKIPFSFLFLGILTGLYLYQSALPENLPENISHYSGESDITVIGVVNTDPRNTSRYVSTTVRCEKVFIDGEFHAAKGKIRITLPQGFLLAYGDRIELRGELTSTIEKGESPITSHNGREKLFTKMDFPTVDILSSDEGNPILSMLFSVRKQANEIIFDMIPFPESAILAGILLGMDTSIPAYLWDGYRASGIAHIIVISGFNISTLAIVLFRFLEGKVRNAFQIPLVIGSIFLYTILVGADIPVVRAAIMATIGLPATRLGRKTIGIHNLTLAATFMLCLNPFLLWDISFQLSFLATLSLLVLVEPFMQQVLNLLYRDEKKRDKPHLILDLIITTLCASFTVFPVLFPLTGNLSLSSIPANILVAPLQPLIMFLGGSAVLFGLFFPFVSRILGMLVWPLIAACNQIALRLSVHPSTLIYLPKWVYFFSLIGVVFSLVFFSYRQIAVFSKPNNRSHISDN